MVVKRLIFSRRLGMMFITVSPFMEDLQLGSDLVVGCSLSWSVVNPWCVMGLTVLMGSRILPILFGWHSKCLDLPFVILLEHRRELVLNMP